MPRDRRDCACGCGESVSSSTQRRHLRQKTTKSVLVAQEHDYREQRRRLLRLHALALDGAAPSQSHSALGGNPDPVEDPADDNSGMGMEDIVPSGRAQSVSLENFDDDSGDGSDSDADGDPFEGRPDEIFWEESDEEEDCALGDDFQAAPWLQGLSAEERLQEVFNIDAAMRGMAQLSSSRPLQ